MIPLGAYIYWKDIRQHGRTCAVAELDGKIVGWCSVTSGATGTYFLHQLGIDPTTRRIGLAEELVLYVIRKLKAQKGFELEFTIDQTNTAALHLFAVIAERAGMQLLKRPDPVRLLEKCDKKLYAMKPLVKRQRTRLNFQQRKVPIKYG